MGKKSLGLSSKTQPNLMYRNFNIYCRGEAFAVIGLKYYVYAERQMLRPYAWPQKTKVAEGLINVRGLL
ncbi:MAG: hypothetical protein EDM77_10205 [Candidatus Jettenia sp. AMX1]|nr:MAG: hypothetical protein EDM77_10205 [Candidatus Jettenia sp. AMX1]